MTTPAPKASAYSGSTHGTPAKIADSIAPKLGHNTVTVGPTKGGNLIVVNA